MSARLTAEEHDLLRGFESCTIDKFTHEHHVHVAWLYLQRHLLVEAVRRFSEGAKALAASRGRPDVYHETMTWAYMLVINERMARDGREMSWTDFSQTHADLLDHSNTVLHRYYHRETLESPLARKTFLLPDRRGEEGETGDSLGLGSGADQGPWSSAASASS